MSHKFSWLLLLSLWLTACSQTHETTLDNGLRVIVHEDHRSPVVVSQIWYQVGSQDEPEGGTGISHVLEHMMFKGTAKHGPNEFSRIIAENGGRENAFTSYDYTAYQPQPCRLPVIGWRADLESMTAKELRDWYGRWYAPANAILVVVGDVKPKEVIAQAQKYFGQIPARFLDRAKEVVEPEQKGERRLRVAVPAEVPYLLMGYHVPVHASAGRGGDVAEWEPYALSVLTGVLDGGQAARFERELVREKKLAAGIGTDYSAVARSPGLLMIDATPANGHTVAELEQAIRAQIERIKNEPASAEELKRVKAQVVASNVFSRDSVFYQAMQIGRLAAVGLDWRMIDDYPDKLKAVTAEQVQTVARKYLVDAHLTVAVLDPQPMGKGQRRMPRPRGGGDVR